MLNNIVADSWYPVFHSRCQGQLRNVDYLWFNEPTAVYYGGTIVIFALDTFACDFE